MMALSSVTVRHHESRLGEARVRGGVARLGAVR
jgi:hypothetical protein